MYNYKVWYFDAEVKRRVLSSYSNKFRAYEEAIQWYKNYGIALEKMFDRKLVLKKTDNNLDSNI